MPAIDIQGNTEPKAVFQGCFSSPWSISVNLPAARTPPEVPFKDPTITHSLWRPTVLTSTCKQPPRMWMLQNLWTIFSLLFCPICSSSNFQRGPLLPYRRTFQDLNSELPWFATGTTSLSLNNLRWPRGWATTGICCHHTSHAVNAVTQEHQACSAPLLSATPEAHGRPLAASPGTLDSGPQTATGVRMEVAAAVLACGTWPSSRTLTSQTVSPLQRSLTSVEPLASV